jgi:hypothetical protein
MSIELSLYLVVRNESSRLARAIESARDYVDEIVVLDTGSTDDTRDVARTYTDRVFQFEWVDDFSAAHNRARSHCRGKWLFWLDGDEWIVEGSAQGLRSAIQREDIDIVTVLRRDLTRIGDFSYTEMPLHRLFRRSMPEFIGCNHPHFVAPIDVRRIAKSPISIWHEGYANGTSQEKLRRGIRLNLKELALRPNQPYYEVELYISALKAQPDLAKQWQPVAHRRMEEFMAAPDPDNLIALRLLEAMVAESPSGERRRSLMRYARSTYPRSAAVLWAAAGTAYQAGCFEEALDYLNELEDIRAKNDYLRGLSFHSEVLSPRITLNRGVVLVRLTRLDEAEIAFTSLLDEPEYAEAARKNLAVIENIKISTDPGNSA